MSLTLVPYNDAMRLGMGFNSYTQAMCIADAVKVELVKNSLQPERSQVVTYSAKLVERLSEVVSTMKISYSTSIRKGTIEVAGNSNTIDEDKIKEADINAVISVNVVNQTTSVKETAEFDGDRKLINNYRSFTDVYGDSYISGFIEGGSFNGVVSFRVLERSKSAHTVTEIKKAFGNFNSKKKGFKLRNDSLDGRNTGSDASDTFKETQNTVTVSYLGGGQIKDPNEPWNIDTVFKTAAAFPARVAATPQKTWATLTKYTANRSFLQWQAKYLLNPLEYDLVTSYTATLFDSYMAYKQMLKSVQNMIETPSDYVEQNKKMNFIKLEIKCLIATRAAIRSQMVKLVRAVDVLANDPKALLEFSESSDTSDDTVNKILSTWANEHPDKTSEDEETNVVDNVPNPPKPQVKFTKPPAEETKPSADGNPTSKEGKDLKGKPDTESNSSTKSDEDFEGPPPKKEHVHMNFRSLMPPELWSDILPLLKRDVVAPVDQDNKSLADKLRDMLPKPPANDPQINPGPITTPDLRIVLSVCGGVDVTSLVQQQLQPDKTITISSSQIRAWWPRNLSTKVPPYLVVIYQYVQQPIQIMTASVTSESSDRTWDIAPRKNPIGAEALPNVLNPTPSKSFIIQSVIYGGEVVTDAAVLDQIKTKIEENYKGGAGKREVVLTDVLMKTPAGRETSAWQSALIFYTTPNNTQMRCAIGWSNTVACRLTDEVISNTASPTQVITYEDPEDEAVYQTRLYATDTITLPGETSWELEGTGLTVRGGRSEPFLKFDNGVQYFLLPSGELTVQDGLGNVSWSSKTTINGGDPSALTLNLGGDGTFALRNGSTILWQPLSEGEKNGKTVWRVMLRDRAPFVGAQWFTGMGEDGWSKPGLRIIPPS